MREKNKTITSPGTTEEQMATQRGNPAQGTTKKHRTHSDHEKARTGYGQEEQAHWKKKQPDNDADGPAERTLLLLPLFVDSSINLSLDSYLCRICSIHRNLLKLNVQCCDDFDMT